MGGGNKHINIVAIGCLDRFSVLVVRKSPIEPCPAPVCLLVCSASRRSALSALQGAALKARRTRKSMIDSSRRATLPNHWTPRKEAGFTVGPITRAERPAEELWRPIACAHWEGGAQDEARRGDNVM